MFMNSAVKQSDYQSVKKTLSKVNKSMYRTSLYYDPISLLEKSAITGRIFDKKEPRPKKKPRIPPDSLTLSLKPEHKNIDGIKIYQLPKLPFGIHSSYNHEEGFVEKHFKMDEKSDELSQNLELLTRKFRLKEKNSSKRAKSSHKKTRKRQLTNNMDSFRMESGYLICRKEKHITEIYEQDKEKYLKDFTIQTFRDLENFRNNTDNKTRHLSKKKHGLEIFQRLYPTREDNDSPISKFYKSKYGALFTESEPSTRPVTSFQALNWKSLLN